MRSLVGFGLLTSAAARNFCDGLDTILVEPVTGKFAGDAYFFQGNGYIKYDAVRDTPITTDPTAISSGWPGLPNDIDATLTAPPVDEKAGQVFVFKGSQVWTWDAKTDTLSDGPKDFATEFPGLPSEFYKGVDAIFVETSIGLAYGQAFFFKGGQYAAFDLRTHTAKASGSIVDRFPGVPDTIDAVLMEPHILISGLQKFVYFFKADKYWKWDTTTDTLVSSDNSIQAGWNLCPPAPAPPVPPELPEQVHIAFGKTMDSMTVAWTTAGEFSQEVQWGADADSLTSRADADTRAFTQDAGRTWYTHTSTMTGLATNTRYFYRVGANDTYTKVFNFTNRLERAPYKHIIIGDLGSSCGFSLCNSCTSGSEECKCEDPTQGVIGQMADAGMILHMGDFGYDLDSNDGRTGDQFMRNIEQVAAYVPYMVSHGNHEDGSKSLAHYVERFRSQPSNAVPSTFTSSNGETTNTMYFSWDYGLVHYISLSTEIWFGVTDGKVNLETQLAWVEEDLKKASKNRENVPWIIVQGHRSIYCSCDGDCDSAAKTIRDDLEEMFMDYGVDFFFNGHEHNYERSYPLYKGNSSRSNIDPKGPIYVVSGAAGSREMHEPFTRNQPTWSAFRSNTFGYSVLDVYNKTHVHLQYVQTDPTGFLNNQPYDTVIDDDWIVQHLHGPFDRALAPTGAAFPQGLQSEEFARSRQYDHWWPLLDLEDNSGRATHHIIQDFRAQQGENAWVEKLHGLMKWVDVELGAEIMWRNNATSIVHWEDVRDDGSSDCAACGAPEVREIYDFREFYDFTSFV